MHQFICILEEVCLFFSGIIDERRPPYPVHTATYMQILTWFLDIPVQEAPYSVHRMTLAGKVLHGREILASDLALV